MNYAIVTAAGSGIRTGYKVPKQFLTVYDVPVIIYTLQNIAQLDCINKIVVVVPDGWQNFVQAYVEQNGVKKIMAIISGGSTRFQSVFKGIEMIIHDFSNLQVNDTLIGIDDGNRPLIPEEITLKVIEQARIYGAAVALEPCYDTMVQCQDSVFIQDIVDRKKMFRGQCPEFFKQEKF